MPNLSVSLRRARTMAVLAVAAVCAATLAVPAAATEAASWSVATSLPGGRSGADAVRLADGSVLLAGGYDFSGGGQTYLISALRWSPATGAWTSAGYREGASAFGYATRLTDGRVLTAGGTSSAGTAAPEVFDPAADSWTPTLAPPSNTVAWLAPLPGGRALAGLDGLHTVTYEPGLNGWAAATDLPGDHGAGARAAALPDGRIVVIGGANGRTDVYDPASGDWTAKTAWARPRTGSSVVVLSSGRVVVVGGTPNSSQVDVWSAADGWAAGTDAHYVHTASDSAALLRGDSVFAQGGGHYGEVYDPIADAWHDAGLGGAFREYVPAVSLADGRVLLPGGGVSPVSAVVETYVPAPLAAPVVVTPAAGPVSGDVALSATNDQADTIRFLADGVLVAAPAATDGTANGTFGTWGLANGSYDLTAQACNVAGCGPLSAPIALTVANDAPALTVPGTGATLEGQVTFEATAAGGGVRFTVDGVTKGFDGTAPYAASVDTFALTPGTHTARAVSCRADGSLCGGPATDAVTFTVDHRPALDVPASPLAGSVPLTVTGRGATVAAYVDGLALPGVPVEPADGVAVIAWSTYGLANGTHLVTAKNCDPGLGCLEATDPVTVTVTNSTPAIDGPAGGTHVATPTTLLGSSSGGTLRFDVDGAPAGAPVGAPYDLAFDPKDYAPGEHTVVARQCAADGGLCEGPASAPVTLVTEGPPLLDAPADGATVGGAVALTARSAAPAVRFDVGDAPLGAPVPTVEGTAHATWPTFGLPNGAYDVAVRSCATACTDTVRTAHVTLANAAPVVTSPPNGAHVGDAYTFTATAPIGAGVRWFVDGVDAGFRSAAPYSLRWVSAGWGPGAHTVTATECSADGIRCDGPVSGSRAVSVVALHPAVSASPARFSPNGDRVKDTTLLRYTLDTASTAVLRVRNAAGLQVWAAALGAQAQGAHTRAWNGRTSGGGVLPDGTYHVVVETTKAATGTTLRGSATSATVLDRTAPGLAGPAGSGTLYPVHDGYADTYTGSVTVSEAASLVWRVYNAAGAVVATRSASGSAGARPRVTWDGRLRSGAIAPAGTYAYQWTAVDAAGNTRRTARYAFAVSAKHLVAKSVVLTKNGDAAYSGGGSEPSCSEARDDLSYYEHGVWLLNVCDYAYDGVQLAAAFYRVTLPPAVKYGGMRLDVTGFSINSPTQVQGVVDNVATGSFDVLPGFASSGDTEATRTVGSFGAANHVSGRTVGFGIVVADYNPPSDWDIKTVRLTATYYVLA